MYTQASAARPPAPAHGAHGAVSSHARTLGDRLGPGLSRVQVAAAQGAEAWRRSGSGPWGLAWIQGWVGLEAFLKTQTPTAAEMPAPHVSPRPVILGPT